MAKLLFTAFLADARGKLNGSVFSKNRGGAYVRTKVTPTNPQTSYQSLVRSRLANFSAAWRGLSESVRAQWNASVSTFARTNVFGAQKLLSGHQLYVGLNSQIEAAGGSAITSPPLPLGATSLTALAIAIDISDTEVEATFAPTVPTGHAMVVEATAPMSPGISNYSNQFRQIAVTAAAATSPQNYWADYIAKFGAPAAGQKVALRLRNVRLATGETSQAVIAEAIVSA